MSLTTNGKEGLGNHLLAALPEEAYERLRSHLDPISFSLGEVVYESGGHMRYVYFPTTSHISLRYTMIDGSTAEMGLVGKEGVVRHRAIHVRRNRTQPGDGARRRSSLSHEG